MTSYTGLKFIDLFFIHKAIQNWQSENQLKLLQAAKNELKWLKMEKTQVNGWKLRKGDEISKQSMHISKFVWNKVNFDYNPLIRGEIWALLRYYIFERKASLKKEDMSWRRCDFWHLSIDKQLSYAQLRIKKYLENYEEKPIN